MKFSMSKTGGIASLGFAGIGFFLMFFFFLLIVPFVNASYPSSETTPALIMGGTLAGVFVLFGMGLLSGFAGIFEKNLRKLSVFGVFVNLLFLAVYLLGLRFLV